MKALILAAGKGTRLNSAQTHIPKVLREACGKPLVEYVLGALPPLDPADIGLVVGFEKEKVIDLYQKRGYFFAVQTEQLGTGHAVLCAEEALSGYDGELLVLCGDMPLIRRDSIERLISVHREHNDACTLLTCVSEPGLALGRIVRDENGAFAAIVENKVATDEQKKICEYNAGVYVFACKKLFPILEEIVNDRKTGEAYLTDVPEKMLARGMRVTAISCREECEIFGVNTKEDLDLVEETLRGGAY